MRVVLVGTGVQPIPPPGYGGVERTIAELASALQRQGAEVEVLQQVRHGRSRDEYWFARDLPSLLPSDPGVVLHASTPVVANRLSVLGRRYVYTSHSRHWFERRRLTEHWGAYLERRAVRRSAHSIALTSRLERTMIAACGPKVANRLSVIPLGVDTEKFRPGAVPRTGARAVGVGIVAPFKRWELAARALRGTGISLQIAGPTPDPGYAREVQRSGERVELLGEVSEERLIGLLAGADLCLHPSRVELLAGAVLQAMACGVPVLGAEPVDGLVRNGETGATAAAGLSDEALVAWFHDQAVALRGDDARRAAWGRAAREVAEREYSWPAVANAHLSLYTALSNAGRS